MYENLGLDKQAPKLDREKDFERGAERQVLEVAIHQEIQALVLIYKPQNRDNQSPFPAPEQSARYITLQFRQGETRGKRCYQKVVEQQQFPQTKFTIYRRPTPFWT